MAEQNNSQQSGGKELVKQTNNFKANMKKLEALMKGELKPKKQSKDSILAIASELVEERRKEAAKEIKTNLTSILENKVKLDKEIKAKREELDKLITAKYKEFNQAMSQLLQKVEGMDDIEKEYAEALGSVEETD